MCGNSQDFKDISVALDLSDGFTLLFQASVPYFNRDYQFSLRKSKMAITTPKFRRKFTIEMVKSVKLTLKAFWYS